jgi:hypothetical protein
MHDYKYCELHPIIIRQYNVLGFKVLTAAVMNVAIFWDIAPSSPYVNRRFGEMYYLQQHLADGFLLSYQFLALKMELIRSSETSVHIWTTRPIS